MACIMTPAFLAANMQSLRKYIEHVGLTGTTVRQLALGVLFPTGGLADWFLSHTPSRALSWRAPSACRPPTCGTKPQFAEELAPKVSGERPPFRSYRHAFRDLFHSLNDPRVGAQWDGGKSYGEQTLAKAG